MAIKVYASGNTLTVGIDTYAPNSGLTASVSTETGYTDYVIVQDSAGKYPLTALYSDIVKQDGTTAWGASASATRDALNTLFGLENPSGYGLKTEIDELKKAIQIDKTTGGGRGLYYDDGKSTTSSKVSVGDRIASVQGGRYTGLSVTESSPGTHTFNVAAGASGVETQFSALTLVGSTTADRATFNILDGTRFQFEDKNGNFSYIDMQNVTASRVYALPNSSGTIALTSDIGTPGISNVVEDTTPQLGGDLDTNGFNLDLSSDTNSQLIITGNQYAFRYRSTSGVLQNTGLYFNLTTGQYEFLDGSGNCIFCIKAGSGELSIGDMSGGTNFVLPTARGTDGQILKIDGSGNVDWASADLEGMNDVLLISPATGNLLQYNSALGVWYNTSAVSGLTSIGTGSLTVTGSSTLAQTSVSSLTFSSLGASTISPGVLETDLDISSNGNVSIKLDADNDETGQKFAVFDPGTTERFSVSDTGVTTINNAYTLPTADGTNGQVLTTNGSGAASWADAGGGGKSSTHSGYLEIKSTSTTREFTGPTNGIYASDYTTGNNTDFITNHNGTAPTAGTTTISQYPYYVRGTLVDLHHDVSEISINARLRDSSSNAAGDQFFMAAYALSGGAAETFTQGTYTCIAVGTGTIPSSSTNITLGLVSATNSGLSLSAGDSVVVTFGWIDTPGATPDIAVNWSMGLFE